jgi:hypothetical protein
MGFKRGIGDTGGMTYFRSMRGGVLFPENRDSSSVKSSNSTSALPNPKMPSLLAAA